MRRHHLLIVAASLVAVGLIGGCSDGWNGSTAVGPGWPGHMGGGHMRGFGSTGSGSGVEAPVPGASEIRITGGEFEFIPHTVTLTVGEPVNLRFVNDGLIVHDFTIPEFEFTLRADPGEEVVGGFTPNNAGEFEALCTIPGHSAQGMVARVVVGVGS